MSTAHSTQSLQWVAEPDALPDAYPDSYWRSLFYFNVYRLAVAVLLLTSVAVWGNAQQFGIHDVRLFAIADGAYIVFGAACFALISMRWRFNLQLTLQVAADICFIVILMYASGGISSGLGLLLLTTLAGAGLISRGRLTLFYAALASIAMLLEHTYEVLSLDASVAQFVQAGLLSGGYFATALLAHALAKRMLASERLAAQREIDLENMAQVNQLVIQDMQDGVLVVDDQGLIRQFNARAERVLGLMRGREMRLKDYAPALAARLEEWRNDAAGLDVASDILFNRTLNARFVPAGRSRRLGAVIFLEDLTRIQAEARQMKLAALGRLTANIAHEIRNPLGAISHAAELLQEEPAINATSTRLLAIIHDNTKRLDRMVNDVLRLNRGDRAHRESFKLVDYLKNFVAKFCEIEKISRDVIEIDAGEDYLLLFDHNHLDQVMWNLCRNALRHCRQQKGSIHIGVSAERGGGDIVKLDVVDDGPGVPATERGQLFEPFFTTARGGTGLGLYIAREVCEANDATLDYVETPSGAQFTVLCRGG